MEVKTCTTCNKEKKITEFYTQYGKYITQCKLCIQNKIKTRYSKNRDSINSKMKEKRKSNPRFTLYYNAKQRARRNNIPFKLDMLDIPTPEFCPILGLKLEISDKTVSPNSPTLDKIIPELGYVKGNIQVISNRANSMKNDASISELLLFAEWVFNNFKDKDE